MIYIYNDLLSSQKYPIVKITAITNSMNLGFKYKYYNTTLDCMKEDEKHMFKFIKNKVSIKDKFHIQEQGCDETPIINKIDLIENALNKVPIITELSSPPLEKSDFEIFKDKIIQVEKKFYNDKFIREIEVILELKIHNLTFPHSLLRIFTKELRKRQGISNYHYYYEKFCKNT